MKLHLPKLLFVAIIAAAGYAQADVTSVAFHTGADNLPSAEGNCVILESLTLGMGDKYGAFDKEGNALALGQMLFEKPLGASWKDKSTGNATKNVVVSKTLTINDDAEVRLGGQYRLVNNYYLTTSTKADEYTGIIADKIVVTGKEENGKAVTTNLSTWNATVNTLEVNSGKVEIRRQVQSGNNFFNFGAPVDSKQAQFKRAINVNGGETYINLNSLDSKDKPYNNLDDQHIFSTFGEIVFKKGGKDGTVTDYSKADYAEVHGATITQTAGKLVVEGKTASVGGLNIDQSGGTMCISTNGTTLHSWHILSDYGDSKIEQSGKAGTVLNIGGIGAFNSKYNAVVDKLAQYGASYDDATGELVSGSEKVDVRPVLELIQSGAGEINIFKGVDFSDHRKDNVEDSSITQSGGGKINLGGEYKGVTFDITQEDKGGVLNINGDLKTDVVKQNGAGSIVVASSKTLSANTVYAGTVVETHDSEGNVTSRSGSVEISGNVNLTDGELKTETSENGAVTVTNEGSLKADKITVSGDTFVNKGVIVALSSQADAALMMLSGSDDASGIVVVEGGKYVEYGTCEKSILVQEGGTLTLLDGSNVADVTLESGTINVTGTATVGSLTLNDTNSINFNFNGEVAPSIVLTSDDALDLSSTTIKVTVSTEMLENLAGKDFELFGGNVENITNATYIFTDGDADTSNDKIADVILGSTSGSIKVENVQNIPEPTTATLSLLALAGLCARRRRR